MSRVKNQQLLTDLFAAKKSTKTPAKQALEKLRTLQADHAEIKARRTTRSCIQSKEKSPAFERYADLLSPKLEDVEKKSRKVEEKTKPPSPSKKSKSTCNDGKSALSRLEAKRAAIKAAREKLKQVEKDQTALREVQQLKKSQEKVIVPAYEKYHYLTVPSTKLPLPLHYQRLLDGFSSCDTIVSMFHNRKEICRFDRISSAVSKMTRHNFGLEEIGKILTMKDDAYTINVEQHRFLDTREKFHHILDFPGTDLALDPKFLSKRKSELKEKLLTRTAQYHQEFIDSVMPGSDLPIEAVKRWHPKFQLDSIPDIPAQELPQIKAKSEIVNAREVLETVRGKFSDRIEKALQSLAEKQEKEEKPTDNSKSTAETPEKPAVTGVNQSLLDRIKKREALKMAEKMVMSGDEAKDQRQLATVSALIRTIRQIFLSWPKAAIPYCDLRAKILDSSPYDDLDTLLTRVADLAPEWYKPLFVRNTKFVKIDKARDVNIICERVEAMIKKEPVSKGL